MIDIDVTSGRLACHAGDRRASLPVMQGYVGFWFTDFGRDPG